MKILIFLVILTLLAIGTYFYAKFIGAKGFIVKEYKVENSKLIKEYDGFKIVHISDIHYGISTTKKDLDKIVKNINLQKPDLIFLTGDLIDGKIDDIQHKEIVNSLIKLKATIGKYAISGNHDHYYKKWNELIDDCGFTNINDTYDIIFKNSYKSIFIAGISDNIYSSKNIIDKTKSIFEYMSGKEIENSVYKILLMHEPDYIDDIDYNKFNLILSGHSHNGQVRIPFIGAAYTPIGSKKYYKEYYKLNNTDLYISSGIGTTCLPIRLFNKPSYNFYRIVSKKN